MSDPITAQAEATKALAETTGKALELAEKAGSFWAKVFGEAPRDLVGLLGGDFLHHARQRNLDRLARETEKILFDRGVSQPKQISASIAIPLLAAAEDENRDELRELWARLLANAMDPNRPEYLRQSMIEAVRLFHPVDALILSKIRDAKKEGVNIGQFDNYIAYFELDVDVSVVSLENLEKLNCITGRELGQLRLTHFGRLLIKACDP